MALIVVFSLLIAFGAAGNGLVCYVVIANAHMRTPRNLLILNLASSDLVLCLFTQPFNLMKVANVHCAILLLEHSCVLLLLRWSYAKHNACRIGGNSI